jgi:hypothetical protein
MRILTRTGTLGDPRPRRKNNTKIDLKEIGREVVGWIQIAWDVKRRFL